MKRKFLSRLQGGRGEEGRDGGRRVPVTPVLPLQRRTQGAPVSAPRVVVSRPHSVLRADGAALHKVLQAECVRISFRGLFCL